VLAISVSFSEPREAAMKAITAEQQQQNVEQSERKLVFLRKLYAQTKIDNSINPQRKAVVLQRIVSKAAWHHNRIDAANRLNCCMGCGRIHSEASCMVCN